MKTSSKNETSFLGEVIKLGIDVHLEQGQSFKSQILASVSKDRVQQEDNSYSTE